MNNSVKNPITAQSFMLRTENGSWLGQIVLTSDGMFAAVTDWGNITFAWRAWGEKPFPEFLCSLDTQYFAGKMRMGISDFSPRTKQTENQCNRFAEKILPALQKAIKEQINQPAA